MHTLHKPFSKTLFTSDRERSSSYGEVMIVVHPTLIRSSKIVRGIQYFQPVIESYGSAASYCLHKAIHNSIDIDSLSIFDPC